MPQLKVKRGVQARARRKGRDVISTLAVNSTVGSNGPSAKFRRSKDIALKLLARENRASTPDDTGTCADFILDQNVTSQSDDSGSDGKLEPRTYARSQARGLDFDIPDASDDSDYDMASVAEILEQVHTFQLSC